MIFSVLRILLNSYYTVKALNPTYYYWKGVSAKKLNLIKWEGYIKPTLIRKAGREIYGVYVTKSSKLAAKYGDFVLKINLKGRKVIKSPHSNQFIVLGAIKNDKIVSVEEVVR